MGGDRMGCKKGEMGEGIEVFEGGVGEVCVEWGEMVVELIEENCVYGGEEEKGGVEGLVVKKRV